MATDNDNRGHKWDDILLLAQALSVFINPPVNEWQGYLLEFSATRKESGELLIDKISMLAKQQGKASVKS